MNFRINFKIFWINFKNFWINVKIFQFFIFFSHCALACYDLTQLKTNLELEKPNNFYWVWSSHLKTYAERPGIAAVRDP